MRVRIGFASMLGKHPGVILLEGTMLACGKKKKKKVYLRERA